MDSTTLYKLPKWIEHSIYTFLGRDYDGKDSSNINLYGLNMH